MPEILSTINGIDLLFFLAGAAVMAVAMWPTRCNHPDELDLLDHDDAFDRGWMAGWRDRRVLGDAIAEVMAEEQETRKP